MQGAAHGWGQGFEIPVSLDKLDETRLPAIRRARRKTGKGSWKEWGMSDIAELESRLSAALDRIATGVGRMGEAEPPQALVEELAAEREANAQLEARVLAIKEKQETMVAALQADVARLTEALSGTDTDLQRLKSVNAELRATNAALRTANAAGLPDADLVNSAMSAEVDALRALEAGNRAEIDRALGMLEPMLREVAHA